MKTIKLLIVDDSEIHIIGIKTLLKNETDIHIIGEAYTVKETMEQITKEIPDMILLDISLESESDGIDLAYRIQKQYPSIHTIILSHYKDIHYIISALHARVRGYLAKDTRPEQLLGAIRAVSNGEGVFFGDSIAYKTLLKAYGNETNLMSGKPHELTEREIQVIEHLAQGYSSKEISALMGIDKNTVESHKERIKNKLGLNSIVEIVVFAIKYQIIKL